MATTYADFIALPTTEDLDVLTDQLELQLTGGLPSDDSAHDWRYLRLCVAEAYDNEVMEVNLFNDAAKQADYLARKKDELESYFLDQKAKSEYWESPDRWIQAFPAPIILDKERNEQFFVLPPAFVALRRYQNLESENTVRDIVPVSRLLRDKYLFAYLPTGARYHRRSPGGLLGRWGYYHEQTMSAKSEEQHRVYLDPPKGCILPESVKLNQLLVLRDSRTSGLPAPPQKLVTHLNVVRKALDIALFRTRQDRTIDANPQPTQAA